MRLRDIFLVALTGSDVPRDHRRALEAHLVKPADLEQLHELPEPTGAPA
jgi:hypothetical protein